MPVAPSETYVIGVDFGTLSGRAVVVRVADGAELGSAVHEYPHAVLTDALPDGTPLGHDWALQVPGDYVEVLQQRRARRGRAPPASTRRRSSASAPTSPPARWCPPWPTAPRCSELDGLGDRPHAYVKLWQHHAAQPQADRINQLAAKRGEPWLPRYGGLISSEWEFAKGAAAARGGPGALRRDGPLGRGRRLDRLAAHRRVRPQRLHRRLQGHPPGRALPVAGVPGRAQPGVRRLRRRQARPADRPARRGRRHADAPRPPAGPACPRASRSRSATSTRTSPRPPPRRSSPGQMVAIMGTSTCHVMNGAELREVPGMCGVVDGGIVAGPVGLRGRAERRRRHLRPLRALPRPDVHPRAADRAGRRRSSPGEHGLLALDWHSGNRSVLVDHELSGLVVGETLATRPEDVYRALIEATAFGTRTIVETFDAAGRAGARVRRRRRADEEPRCSCRSTPTCCGCRCR